MTEHLVRAAKARHEDVTQRATRALHEMAKTGEMITFAAVARRAGVSTDFLYNNPALRSRITDLRTAPQKGTTPTSTSPVGEIASSTTAIRALSAQMKEQRRRYRDEVDALQKLLDAAHGENLELRRRLAHLDG